MGKRGIQAIRLANEILKTLAGCKATDTQKREIVCLLPRRKARPEKCNSCPYWNK